MSSTSIPVIFHRKIPCTEITHLAPSNPNQGHDLFSFSSTDAVVSLSSLLNYFLHEGARTIACVSWVCQGILQVGVAVKSIAGIR
jgi:hypothetical protein